MTVDWRYRTFWRRAGAALIDFLVVLPLILAQAAVVGTQLHPALKAVVYAICAASVYGYSVAMHWRFGATLGKMAFGVKVLGLPDEPLTLRQAFLRDALNIAYATYQGSREISAIAASVPTITESGLGSGSIGFILIGLEIVTMLTNAKRRSLHDFIAGTVVVRTQVRAGA